MRGSRRARLVPEVLQASMMDCGPAALKAVLNGFGIPIGYDELRERCQTDVDGTSLDALAALGRELGLDSRQVLVPREHLLLPEARCLPAIVVSRSGAGPLHFMVLWSSVGSLVQTLDPGSGRRWLRRERFLELLPDLPVPISNERWLRWAQSGAAHAPWQRRARRLGVGARAFALLWQRATQAREWRAFAALDAALRMAEALVESGAVRRGRGVQRLLAAALAPSGIVEQCALEIPPRFWWATDRGAAPGKLLVRGNVVVVFQRRATFALPQRSGAAAPAAQAGSLPARLAPDGANGEPPAMGVLWSMLWRGSHSSVLGIVVALLASSVSVPLEVLLLRGMLQAGRELGLDYQRQVGLALVLGLVGCALWLDLWSGGAARRLARRMEVPLHAALYEKLPRLPDRYLRSRPSSDLAGRAHALHLLREVPLLWLQLARAALTALATVCALCWLYPEGTALTVVLSLSAFALLFLGRRTLTEATLRLRTHSAALDRFYLDALLGLSPIRVHGAERQVRAAHEELLTEWSSTARQLHEQQLRVQGAQLLASSAASIALVGSFVSGEGEPAKLLLLAFWALRVPACAVECAVAAQALRALRGVALRIVSPLMVATATTDAPTQSGQATTPAAGGVQLSLAGVTVMCGGRPLLAATDLEIAAGERVAIVGASGAGKSSLLSLFLGWLAPAQGRLLVDGAPLDAERLEWLREQTAWIDPALQLWEASLYDNLMYARDEEPEQVLPVALARAELLPVLERQPAGLESNLGEGGARLSGGEGQRVRLGRALARREARLVLLDEPFRGLERPRRRELLQRLQQHWPHATWLFVSHDVADALEFSRVLVLRDGKIVEDGDPRDLSTTAGGHYAALLRAEQLLHSELWQHSGWRQLTLQDGALAEGAR